MLVALPSAGAVGACDDVACASAGTTRSGAGTCEQGQPLYAEATEATVIVGIMAQTFATVFSDCYRRGAGAQSEGYRELAVVASFSGRETSFYWWQMDDADGSTCRMRVDGAVLVSADCVAGGPPMLPRLS